MEVHEVMLEADNGQEYKRYMLIDDSGNPVVPVIRYLKYLDNTGKADNTLKTYCYHLKLYFEFLEVYNKDYRDVNIDLLSNFVGWLQKPTPSKKVVPIKEEGYKKRSARTVNGVIAAVSSFYNYLIRLDDFEDGITDRMTKLIPGRFKSFKPFLHHITKGEAIKKNILKLKEPKKRAKTLTNEQVNTIKSKCTNIRDELLIRFLYEAGLRIDEALEIWIEDINISKNSISVRKSKTNSGENRIVYVSGDTINLFQDYLFELHDAEGFDTNFVFVRLSGKNKGEQLDYRASKAFIDRIREKTGIEFTPHMLRHSCATELHENGVDVAIIKEILGHKHVQTTIDYYVHPSDKMIQREYENAQKRKK